MKQLVIYLCSIVLLLGLTQCATDDGETYYRGRLYNSNDGSCTVTGEAMDFYIDGEFIATINSGENVSTSQTAGEHTFRVLLTSTQEVLEPGYIWEIAWEGWWYAYGCSDGTYPRSIGIKSTEHEGISSYSGSVN